MKINRYKKVRRILKFYSNNYGFRKPYQILIDGTICVAALKNKINIQEQFNNYLDKDVKLLTTQCIVKEIEELGSAAFGGMLIVKQFGIHHCGHEKSPVLASECILDMIGDKNSSRYIIATQDRELQKKCRKIEAVPLLYLHLKTPTLEPPSNYTQDSSKEKSANNFQLSELEKKKLSTLKDGKFEEPIKRKRKHKGGPNPLSCKKKKKKIEESSTPRNPNKKKRKRNRNRLVKKIKNEIMTSLN